MTLSALSVSLFRSTNLTFLSLSAILMRMMSAANNDFFPTYTALNT